MLRIIHTSKNKILNTYDWKLYDDYKHKYFFNISKSRRNKAFEYYYHDFYKESKIILDFLVSKYEENKI